MIDFETFPLKFSNHRDFELALSLLKSRHPDKYDSGHADMIISFFSAENRDEMKELFSAMGLTFN